jgi:TfoX/Sxy family transcriptional regulator of competence genes
MAYDEELAERVREQLAPIAEPIEMKMFGGLAFMVNTHMACGIIGDELMVRVGKDGNDAAIAAGAREMDFTGKTMAGFVIAGRPLIAADDDLRRWVTVGVDYAKSLPPKKPKTPKPRKRQPR